MNRWIWTVDGIVVRHLALTNRTSVQIELLSVSFHLLPSTLPS